MGIRKIIDNERGVLVSDSIVSILIILIFTGLILTLILNINLESTKVKMNSKHLEFGTKILEYVEKMPYKDVTTENIIEYINSKGSNSVSAGLITKDLTTPYKIAINVEKYGENENKLDLVRIVRINISSDLNNKNYNTDLSVLKKASIEEAKELLENSNS